MFFNNAKKEAVYSTTGLSDLLSSPVFYSVIVLSVILGLSSVFGFLDEPRKLKTVVDVINEKILINPNSQTISFDDNEEFQLQQYSVTSPTNSYSLLSHYGTSKTTKNVNKKVQTVSFDYDITSNQFWGSLDIHQLESLLDENVKLSDDTLILGAPLSSEYSSQEEGDKKYSLAAGLLRL